MGSATNGKRETFSLAHLLPDTSTRTKGTIRRFSFLCRTCPCSGLLGSIARRSRRACPKARPTVMGSHKAIGRLVHCVSLVAAVAPAITTADPGPSSPEKAVFASPAPGSAVGLLSEVIKEKKLDERNGLLLDVKYFDPPATEQAVVLRRVDAGIFPVVSAARVNLNGDTIPLFAPSL